MINKLEQIKDAELVKLPNKAVLDGEKLMKILTLCPAFADLLVLRLAEQHYALVREELAFSTSRVIICAGYGTNYWEDHHMLEDASSKRVPTTL